jgi:hypothetical protein
MSWSILEGLENVVDLGGGYRYSFTERDGVRTGLIMEHPRPDNGETCNGAIDFEPHGTPSHSWKVESWDPLTLSPSLLCRLCGRHGFLRENKWVDA